MRRLLIILKKEFRQIRRDKTILAVMTALPLIQLIILPLAADFEVKKVNLAYYDSDHSTYSNELLHKINSSGRFNIISTPLSYEEAIQNLERSEIDIVLTIPEGFERNLLRQGYQKIMLTEDAINAMKSSIGAGYLSSVIADFNADMDINAQLINKQTLVPYKQIKMESVNWFNPRAEYKYYMVPAILVMLLTLIGGFLTALNIVREKEIGTIEQINVTPIKKWEFILGKLIPFWVVGIFVFTLGLLIMYFFYGIVPQGSIALLYLFAGVYMVAILGFGLLVSTFAENQLQAMFIAFFFIMIFILMSGLFTSIDSMPNWSKQISLFTPITHFMTVIRQVVLKGSQFVHVQKEFFILCAFALVLNGAAILNYRKTS